ncbi:MAG: aminotransferase class I and II [Ktedonobacterales bacterium]|nr:aminotransferase class I and II [Ktedonobacterales bacterium]
MPRTVSVTRYVEPLREGGSLPAIIEADDDGLYVLKFRGAGQGSRALIAELVAGEIGRALGLLVPEIVFAEFDVALGRTERDPEIQALLKASGGLNLALDYLPGALAFDPLATTSFDPLLASRIVWFDAYVTNVDRTIRNTNLLVWHKHLWLIDHGAALYFHHAWGEAAQRSRAPFALAREHVLLPYATQLDEADALSRARITPSLLRAIVEQVPAMWLIPSAEFATAEAQCAAYATYLSERLEASRVFVEGAKHARAALV